MSRAPAIPSPRLQHVNNQTPFPHLQFDKMGMGLRFHDVVVVCASFVLDNGRLQTADVHRGPVLADHVWDPDHAALSSLRCATDVVLTKPGSDVYVTGTVSSLDAKPRREWHALLRVERDDRPVIHKVLRFTGPRRWHAGWAGWALTDPQATTAVPLRYELAYGGWWYERGNAPDALPRVYEDNPSGSGWFGTNRRHHPRARYAPGETPPAPQIEYLDDPIRGINRRSRVAGFGPIARHWTPRRRFAGTYDAAWLERFRRDPVPDYPADFDCRYFHYAPADQVIAAGLRGDETVQLAGVFADRPAVCANLPHRALTAVCHPRNGAAIREDLRLDTVHVDLDTRAVHLTWRLVLDQQHDIVEIDVFERPLDGRCATPASSSRRSA